MGLILDTDSLIRREKRKLSARETLAELSLNHPGEEFGISVITVAELRHGIHRARTRAQREPRQRFLDDLMDVTKVYPVTIPIALRLGVADAELQLQGRKLYFPDMIIACTALELGFSVLTGNLDHFARIADLRVVSSPA